MMSVMLNTMLCIDLILMVRFPFERKESRITAYVAVSAPIALTAAYCGVFFGDNYNILKIGADLQIAMTFAFLFSFITSVVYTCKKLSGPSFNKEMRRLVLKRHIFTSLAYLFTNTFLWLSFFGLAFLSEDSAESSDGVLDTWWTRAFKIIFAAQGIAIPLLRIAEPFFF